MSANKFRPLGDKILVKVLPLAEMTVGGIIIPDTAKEKPIQGEVAAIGPGQLDDAGNRVPLEVKVGDRVIFTKYGGTEIKFGSEEFKVLTERDILAIYEL